MHGDVGMESGEGVDIHRGSSSERRACKRVADVADENNTV